MYSRYLKLWDRVDFFGIKCKWRRKSNFGVLGKEGFCKGDCVKFVYNYLFLNIF